MRADNTHHLRAAVERRQREAHDRAQAVLAEVQQHHRPISVAAFARAANVARSWIYTQPDLLAAITAHTRTTPLPPPVDRSAATNNSWKQRLDLAHARIRELTAENRALREQLARTHGQLRAQRATEPPPEPTSVGR